LFLLEEHCTGGKDEEEEEEEGLFVEN